MTPLQTIREAYRLGQHLSEEELVSVDFTVATMLSVAFGQGSDPVWAYLVGPPGEGKTSRLVPFKGWDHRIMSLDDLSSKSLISGYVGAGGANYSLLAELADANDKVVLIKDFTVILSKPERERSELLGQLRSAYDQSHSKALGTGTQSYKARFGVFAAVTEAIETILTGGAALGERCIAFRLVDGPRPVEARTVRTAQAFDDADHKSEINKELGSAVAHSMRLAEATIKKGQRPAVSDSQKRTVVLCAELLAGLRSQPLTTGETTISEAANRVVQQLRHIGDARCLADSRREWNEDDLNLVRRVARDSVPRSSFRMMSGLLMADSLGLPLYGSNDSLGSLSMLSRYKTRNMVRQWCYNGLVEGPFRGKMHPDYYRATQEARDLLSETSMVPALSATTATPSSPTPVSTRTTTVTQRSRKPEAR